MEISVSLTINSRSYVQVTVQEIKNYEPPAGQRGVAWQWASRLQELFSYLLGIETEVKKFIIDPGTPPRHGGRAKQQEVII